MTADALSSLKTVRVAVYARKSGNASDPTFQAKQVADWIRQRPGVHVVDVFRDAKSGWDANRPGFNAMLVRALCGDFDAIAIEARDRLARDPAIVKGLIGSLGVLGIEVFIQHPEYGG